MISEQTSVTGTRFALTISVCTNAPAWTATREMAMTVEVSKNSVLYLSFLYLRF